MIRDVVDRGDLGARALPEVEGEVRRLFEARRLRAVAYGEPFATLWDAAGECVLGGKMLRPGLLLGAFDAIAADGEAQAGRPAAVRIAAGVELLHYAFLLHDDVIDGDLVRRGRPNLVGTILNQRDAAAPDLDQAACDGAGPGRRHWATTSGMLVGDMLLSDAHQVFARERLPTGARERLLELLDQVITASIVGEHLDVGLSDGMVPPELATTMLMTELKTAAYTFELPLRAAAILARSTPEVERLSAEAGRHLGVAFQLQDDLLSVFGRAEEHGKDPFSDLRERKETAIIAFARSTASWERIDAALARPVLGDEDARHVRALLVECGAERFTRSLVADEILASRELLASSAGLLPPDLLRFLADLTVSIEERRS